MKKYIQNIWVRLLACILCTVSVLGIAVSTLGMFFFAECPEKEDLLRIGNEKLMKNYAFYAMDNLDEENLDDFFEKTNVYLKVQKLVYESEHAEEPQVVLEYSNMPENLKAEYTIEEVYGRPYGYSTKSLWNALLENIDDGDYEYWVSTPIEGYVFDVNTGLFYYQTEVGFFLADYVYVAQDNVSYDYRLRMRDNDAYYYNSYYGLILDASKYEEWAWVRVGETGKKMSISEKPGSNIIQLVRDASFFEGQVRTENYEVGTGYKIHYLSDKGPQYHVRVAVADKLVQEDLFYEWEELVNVIYGYQKDIVKLQWASIFLFLVGIVLLAVSAPEDANRLKFFHKIPVGIFTLLTIGVEALLGAALVAMIDAFSYNYSWNLAVESVVVPIANMLLVMVFIGFVYIANIMTRIRTKTFYRYSELYYLSRPAVGLYRMAKENTSLFWKGFLLLLAVSVAEFFVLVMTHWELGVLLWFFFGYKLIEFPLVIYILVQMKQLQQGGKRVASGDLSQPIDTSKMFWEFKKHGENINQVGDGIALAVEEQMKSERFKTELITNVSHDIKTPLTSIINYVDLIKKEDITDPTIGEYVEVLDRQSARLKKLIEDLMEASKASTGNLAVHFEECDMHVLLSQVVGEFEEKLMANGLEVVVTKPEAAVRVIADGRHMWRVLDNLMNNVCKYSQPNTRVYIALEQEGMTATVTFKNISKTALNIPSDQLMQRFVRGDSSRHTEGSGLGLSIAQSLTELMNGSMKLEIDGDLFKVILKFNALV